MIALELEKEIKLERTLGKVKEDINLLKDMIKYLEREK